MIKLDISNHGHLSKLNEMFPRTAKYLHVVLQRLLYIYTHW